MIKAISMEELHELTQKLGANDLIIDVRTPDEFAEGHVPRATNIPFDELESRAAEVSGKDHLYLYCRSGRRVEVAASVLHHAGLDQLKIKDLLVVVEGGFPDWEDAGFQIER